MQYFFVFLENKYYDNIDFSNDIYYYKDENSLGNDYLEVSEEDGLIFGNTYYKNNRYGINPILISEEGLELNYIKTINEGTFYLISYIDYFSKKVIAWNLFFDQKTDKKYRMSWF